MAKENKVINWLKGKGLDIAQGAMNGGLLGAASALISKDPELSDNEKIEHLKELNDFQIQIAQEETARILSAQETERKQLDQEDLFTKRARPFRQYAWVILLFVCYPVSSMISGSIIALPWEIITIIGTDMGIYTISRTAEKTKPGGFKLPQIFKRN